ncbi:MAG: protein-tyrosine-phosphatase [Gammaproteobacteria bacterium]|jgi:protein-tyrosine phosphatase|nr:protein-tyrosine-phosphatase [Gammaproteobacteria bacterium]
MLIDCHNHILPALDDGAADAGIALDMARLAVTSGISEIIATPHHLNGVFHNSRDRILEAVQSFQQLLDQHGIALRLHAGSELHLVPEVVDRLQSGDALSFADRGQAVLVELPKHSLPVGTENILGQLLDRGYTPVIAHPERNSPLRARPAIVDAWVTAGCRLQLTGQSCTGEFGSDIQAVCERWCRDGSAYLVASDAHRAHTRPPDLRPAIRVLQRWVGEAGARRLTCDNPRHLVEGRELEKLAVAPSRRRWFPGLAR